MAIHECQRPCRGSGSVGVTGAVSDGRIRYHPARRGHRGPPSRRRTYEPTARVGGVGMGGPGGRGRHRRGQRHPYAGGWNDGSRLATVESVVDRHTWVIDDSIFVNPSAETADHPHRQAPYAAPDPAADYLLKHEGTLDKLFIAARQQPHPPSGSACRSDDGDGAASARGHGDVGPDAAAGPAGGAELHHRRRHGAVAAGRGGRVAAGALPAAGAAGPVRAGWRRRGCCCTTA